MSVTNNKTVADFVSEIRESLERANIAWQEIAQKFAEAREMFGSESDNFKKLLKQTKFSRSTALKLAAIATSERLKKYERNLVNVHSWGTLYAIHSLDDANFSKFSEAFSFDKENSIPKFITINDVLNIKKQPEEKSSLRIYATILIDEDALYGQLIEGEHLQKIYEALTDLESTIPYIKLQRSGIDDKAESRYQSKLNDNFEIAARKQFTAAIAGVLANKNKIKGESQENFEKRFLPMSRQELMIAFIDDKKNAFAVLGSEFESSKIWDKALEETNKWVEKYAKKAETSGNPFAHANSNLKVAA